MLLMQAREAVMQRFRPLLRAHDVTEQQGRILRVLAGANGLDMLELAVRCGIQPPSVSRAVPVLIARGLVRRRSDKRDNRRVIVNLTAAGRKLFNRMAEDSTAVYAQLEADLGALPLQEIYALLDLLVARLGDAETSSESL